MSNATAYANGCVGNAPAFQFYADDFFAGTRDMTCEEVGAYMRLLVWQWTKGPIPDDKRDKVERYVGADWVLIETVLAEKFEKQGSEWRNRRLEQIRIEQAEYRERKSEQARQAANKRWGNNADSNADAYADAMRTQCTPSPTPTPSRIDVESKTTIDIDQGKFGEIERRAVSVCRALRAKSVGDRLLAWRCAVLSSTCYSEHWLFDAVTAVEQGKSKRKPWAYFTRCLREGAKAIDRDFDADSRCVPAPPESVMELMKA